MFWSYYISHGLAGILYGVLMKGEAFLVLHSFGEFTLIVQVFVLDVGEFFPQ